MRATPDHLSLSQARFVSAATGFLSLSWEIVWMRLYNFTTASRASAFGAMLGSYLLGLALGSLWSRRWQKGFPVSPLETDHQIPLKGLIRRANLAAFLVVPIVSWLVVGMWWPWTLPVVMLGAAWLGTVLPMLCHLAIPPDVHAGRRVAGIYLANIIGSGAGSLLTGFVLMDWLPLQWLCLLLLAGSELLCRVMASRLPDTRGKRWVPAVVTASFAAVAFFGYSGLWERLQYRSGYSWGMKFECVIESKHGVITVDTNGTIYGNGTYDGGLDTSLQEGSWLVRPYFISGALHPRPERILVIGVSGGAWTQILLNHPEVKEVVGVELSEAYVRLIRSYPQVSSLLTNPKFRLVIDDGRRWLRHHPEERFDLIVMNTTHHWREFASALLSREFLSLAKGHLREGGIVAWNTTESARAAKTGMVVFPHTLMAMNFCIGSDSPLVPDKQRWRKALEQWKIDGRPVFDAGAVHGRGELERVLAFADNEGPWDKEQRWRWMSRARMEQSFGDAEVITDDNLGHEFAWGNW